MGASLTIGKSGPCQSSMATTTTAAATTRQPGVSSEVQVEFAVNVDKPEDLDKINHLLENNGHRLLSTDFDSKTIKLELDNKTHKQIRSVQDLQQLIEKETGFLAVIKGIGELASAVGELRPSEDSVRNGDNFHGVVRLSQLHDNLCYVDASVGSAQLNPSRSQPLSLSIHEFGNLEGEMYEFIGDPLINIVEDETLNSSRLSVSKTIPGCNVAEMVGRSVALTKVSVESGERTVVSAGVVARASTVQQNKKQVCSCSGKTLWEERIDKMRSELQGGQ